MSGVLILRPEQIQKINSALESARASPIPWSAMQAIADPSPTSVLTLADRKPGIHDLRAQYPSQHVMLGTYRAAISFEEQPAGLMKHLSVSSYSHGKIPGLEVMMMVCEAFGFSGFPPLRPGRIWNEEWQPNRFAINVIEIEP